MLQENILKEAHIWVKNSHKLFNISRRIKRSNQIIFWSPMPNENPKGPCWSWYTCSYSVFQVSKNLPTGNLISSLKIKYTLHSKMYLKMYLNTICMLWQPAQKSHYNLYSADNVLLLLDFKELQTPSWRKG